jgi:hypothetical protein
MEMAQDSGKTFEDPHVSSDMYKRRRSDRPVSALPAQEIFHADGILPSPEHCSFVPWAGHGRRNHKYLICRFPESSRADYVLIHTAPELKDFRPFKENGYQVKPVYGYSLDLSCGVAPLWDGLDKKLRRSIKKAQEAGVLIKEGAKDEINVIYELMDKRYLAQDKYVGVSREYLSDVYESFKGNLKVYVAEHEGIIQTGVIDVGYRGKIRSWIGNPKTSLKNIYPNDLLFWKALESEQEQGYKRYEVMGAAGVERLHSYYANYNPLLEVNYSAVKYSSFRSVLMERMYLCFFRGLLDTIGIRKKLWN